MSLFPSKKKKAVPFSFVLDALATCDPVTRPMFGCLAVYVGPKIVLILRDKSDYPNDNGVWIATSREHHASLLGEFHEMRSIGIFGDGPSNWQVLPKDSPDFESAVLRACELICASDPRIGRVPKPRSPRRKKTARK